MLRATILSLAAAVGGCAAALPAPDGVVEAEVAYRERIAPPPGGTLRVTLYDAAVQDLSVVLAEETLPLDGAGGPPWRVRLEYDPAHVDAGLVYAVRAELRDAEGRLRFRSRGRHYVITQGAPRRVEVLLQAPVSAEAMHTAAAARRWFMVSPYSTRSETLVLR